MLRRTVTLVIVSTALLLSLSCKGKITKSSSITCKVNGACYDCPSSDAAFECVKKMSGTAAGCKATSCK